MIDSPRLFLYRAMPSTRTTSMKIIPRGIPIPSPSMLSRFESEKERVKHIETETTPFLSNITYVCFFHMIL